MFDIYLSRWNLVANGNPIVTNASRILPVLQRGEPAMLKLATDEEECRGAALMEWWDGDGAARVLALDGNALLLEHAKSTSSLTSMARSGHDDEACRILCKVAARLHAPKARPLPTLVPLPCWFRKLEPAAANHGGILIRSAEAARILLAEPRDIGVLHGDLHHGNVLKFGSRGWLAIDPKGLLGEQAFDFANIFTNPDLDDSTCPVATVPHHFRRRVSVVAELAKIERQRLLQWILAWTGLSAAWSLGSGDSPVVALRVAEMAALELDRQ